jgi:EAL domain-containing protein (putative c-di-GMP-specific phosphodiesterase class I)
VIRSRGLQPSSVKIELTESVVMSDPEEALRIIETLHARGIRISIDDFGTGYSSLNYLNRFPVDTLKIDQSFIRDMGGPRFRAGGGYGLRRAAQTLLDSEADAATEIVVTIIGMANNMRVEALAEGVETAEQRDYLVSRGCAKMQGYYFSRPVDAGAFGDLLNRGEALPSSSDATA